MKKLALLATLIFSVMFPSASYAEWTKVVEGIESGNRGINYYVDFERIRKVDGYVYFWTLSDYLKPTEFGNLSAKVYKQGDCKIFRFKNLSFSFHKEPMGRGTGEISNPKNPEWIYPSPNSVGGLRLKIVCSW